MSDEARPLSRRERRALEQRQAAGDADATQLLPTAPTSEGAEAISRRERRRLERLARPMETWTAEEEMIATGQFPALTPEAIAEQETLARERAAVADAEARDAAARLGFTPPAPDAAAPVPERVSTLVTMAQDFPPPEADAPAASDGAAPESPEAADDPPPTPEAPDVVVAELYAPEQVATEGEGEGETFAEAEAEAEAGAGDDDASQAPAQDDDDDARDAFRGMFPPGSLQATALAARSRGQAAPSAFEQAPFPVAGSPDGADEIRRLTEEAMASLARMSPAYKPEVDATGPIEQVEPAQADNEPAPDDDASTLAEGEEAPHDIEAAPVEDEAASDENAAPPMDEATAPADDEASGGDDVFADDEVAAAGDEAADTEPAGEYVPVYAGVTAEGIATPGVEAPAEEVAEADTTPDEVPGEGAFQALMLADVPASADLPQMSDEGGEPGESASVWDALAPASDDGAGKPIFEPVHPGAAATSVPTVWDTHPLTGTPQVTPVRELEDPSPSADVPRPDLSVLLRDHSATEVAAAAAAYKATQGETTTGSTPVERRVPELQPAGGARHFRWAHLAVIGAIAFVLGVLVWNIIKANP